MIKAAIFILLSMFALTSSAHAAQNYNVRFKNASSTKIFISPAPGRCFYIWDVPKDGLELAAGATSSLYKIEDKNAGGDCGDRRKIAYWDLTAGNDRSITSKLVFYHDKDSGWQTKVYEIKGTDISGKGLPVELSGGQCQVSQGLLDCLNNFVNDVVEDGVIIYTISDTKKF